MRRSNPYCIYFFVFWGCDSDRNNYGVVQQNTHFNKLGLCFFFFVKSPVFPQLNLNKKYMFYIFVVDKLFFAS